MTFTPTHRAKTEFGPIPEGSPIRVDQLTKGRLLIDMLEEIGDADYLSFDIIRHGDSYYVTDERYDRGFHVNEGEWIVTDGDRYWVSISDLLFEPYTAEEKPDPGVHFTASMANGDSFRSIPFAADSIEVESMLTAFNSPEKYSHIRFEISQNEYVVLYPDHISSVVVTEVTND